MDSDATEAARERERLEKIASVSLYSQGASGASAQYGGSVFSRFWRGDRCLELGPAEGLMTDGLSLHFSNLTIVEGSSRFCEDLKQRYPKAEVIHALFEDYQASGQFDTIVLGHVLEHVESPQEILKRARQWLAPEGIICAAVPNARSLHRQAAVLMGLLPTEHSLNPTDVHHGHRRVYDPESFRAEFLQAGLRIRIFGGYWLKPLSNAQIDASWTPAMLEAFFQLGERYPDIAAEIYVIAGI